MVPRLLPKKILEYILNKSLLPLTVGCLILHYPEVKSLVLVQLGWVLLYSVVLLVHSVPVLQSLVVLQDQSGSEYRLVRVLLRQFDSELVCHSDRVRQLRSGSGYHLVRALQRQSGSELAYHSVRVRQHRIGSVGRSGQQVHLIQLAGAGVFAVELAV